MPIGDTPAATEAAARDALVRAAGHGGTPAIAWAPGRATLVGEHVDYAGGVVLCMAIDLGIAAAVRRAGAARFLVTSGGVTVERERAEPQGDVADRVLAPVVALRRRGVEVPFLEAGIAATLPAGAGLASSAALMVAMAAAILRLTRMSMPARELAEVALSAEREVLGIPCGPLDQRAVVDTPSGGVLVLDCHTGAAAPLEWPWPEAVLIACDTGAAHDVGGQEYRRRRQETERGLAALGVSTCQELTLAAVNGADLDATVRRRLLHVVGESSRAVDAAKAVASSDLEGLGRLMSASHASLRDLHEVSTPTLDAVAAAAETVPGCLGARMVGAGFGGTVVALTRRISAAACRQAMSEACDGGSTFELRPSPGFATLAPDVVRG
jgi:galactokinase